MIINWLKKNSNNYPQFYQKYIYSFENKDNLDNFIVFDCDFTHSLINNSKIFQIAAIKIKNKEIIINDFFQVNISDNNVIEEETVIRFLDYIQNYNLVSFNINEKIEILNSILSKVNAGKIENELIEIQILYNTFQKIENNNLTLENIAKTLKLSDFYFDNLDEKVFTQALIFIKLKAKLGLKSLF